MTRRFRIRPQSLRLARLSVWGFATAALATVVVWLYPVANGSPPTVSDPYGNWLLLAATVVFGTFAAWFLAFARRLPHSDVCCDEQGIWPARSAREKALIRWQDIACTRDRFLGQRLDLLDARCKTVLALSYDLDGFEDALQLVYDHVVEPSTVALPAVFAEPPGRRRLRVVLLVALIVAVVLLLRADHVALGSIFGGIGALWLGLASRGYTRATVSVSSVELKGPLARKTIKPASLTDIALESLEQEGLCHLGVRLSIAGNDAPLCVFGLSPGALHLRKALDVAHREAAKQRHGGSADGPRGS